jgi:outer membrane immunogenic protein
MRRFLATSGAILASFAIAGQAAAADLGRRDMPMKAPMYAPVYNWTGFYLGINGGGGWGTSSWNSAAAPTGDFDVSGGLVGGTVGYNLHYGQTVLGLEADLAWSGISGSTNVFCPTGCETSNSWLSTVRGRIGYAADRFMPYLTGGVAFGDIEATRGAFGGASSTEAGWTIGGGLEFALHSNWTAKVEYLYVDLGSFDCGFACGAAPPDNINFSTSILRAGLNYRF